MSGGSPSPGSSWSRPSPRPLLPLLSHAPAVLLRQAVREQVPPQRQEAALVRVPQARALRPPRALPRDRVPLDRSPHAADRAAARAPAVGPPRVQGADREVRPEPPARAGSGRRRTSCRCSASGPTRRRTRCAVASRGRWRSCTREGVLATSASIPWTSRATPLASRARTACSTAPTSGFSSFSRGSSRGRSSSF